MVYTTILFYVVLFSFGFHISTGISCNATTLCTPPQTCFNGICGDCTVTGYRSAGNPAVCICSIGYSLSSSSVTFSPLTGAPSGCVGIPCNVKGYAGTPGQCTCAPGFYGVVGYGVSGLYGCKGYPCSTVGYIGSAGSCQCANGYYGTATFSGSTLYGCTPCPVGLISVAGNGNTCSLTIYNYTYNSFPLSSNFLYEYSYDKEDPTRQTVDPNYFNIGVTPDGLYNGLHIQLYGSDLPYAQGSSTCPRSEISGGVSSNLIFDNIIYTVQWQQYIDEYTPGLSFVFAQIFGNSNPNILLKWSNGMYSIWSVISKTIQVPFQGQSFSDDLHEDMNQWTTWKVQFLLSTSGYVNVFRNEVLVGSLTGDLHVGASSYWKQGIYSQDISGTSICTVAPASLWIKNFQLDQGSCIHGSSPSSCACPVNYGATVVNGCCQCVLCPYANIAPAGLGNICALGCLLPGYSLNGPTCTCIAGYGGSAYFSGTTQIDPNGCQMCPSGSSSSAGALQCQLCPQGSYSSTPGSPACSPCPLGTYADTGSTQCTEIICPYGEYGIASYGASISTTCVGISCTEPGYIGMPGNCFCDAGYSGAVQYNYGVPTGCNINQCSPPIYLGNSTSCTCGVGYYGSVTFDFFGSPSGCFPVSCNVVGYTGPDASCQCANGYNGTVGYVGSSPVGCSPIACNNTGYITIQSSCQCGPGYSGIVQYINGVATGCFLNTCTGAGYQGDATNCTCSFGYSGLVTYNLNGLSTGCYPISCNFVGYTGNSANCTCSAGYFGNVTYAGYSPAGCNPCSPGSYSDVPGLTVCKQCGFGNWSASASQTCSRIACPSPKYTTDVTGYCKCAVGYIGNASYTNGLASGCVGISCAVPGYTGVNGACRCAPGFLGTVTYNQTAPLGCIGIKCLPPMYTGPDGSCACSSGYSGTVTYAGNAALGCYPNKCLGTSVIMTTQGICQCAIGYNGTVVFVNGSPTGCKGSDCSLTIGYVGIGPTCSCANGYQGVARFTSTGILTGCSRIPCTGTGYIINGNGACVCDPGYTGTVAYTSNGQLTGCSLKPVGNVQNTHVTVSAGNNGYGENFLITSIFMLIILIGSAWVFTR